MARFPDNTRSIEIVGNGTRTQNSPPITLNLLNCKELEQLTIINMSYVTVYAKNQVQTKFDFLIKPNNADDEEEDTTVVLHKFPRILGTEENGYQFDPTDLNYVYDGSEFQDWRADTLIENPEDHRLYPLGVISSFDSKQEKVTIPNTVFDIRGINCMYIKILDLSACTSLKYPSLNGITFESVFVNFGHIKFILPEHWITSGILMELNQLKVSYTNAYLTDQEEPFVYIKESDERIELINFNDDWTSIEFEPIDIHILIYPGSIEKLIAEHRTIQDIYIPGESYHFDSFAIDTYNPNIQVKVDTQKMKDRLLELNSEANVVINGEDVVDAVYYGVSTTEQLLPYVTLQDGLLSFESKEDKVLVHSNVLEEYLEENPGIQNIYIPGENYSFETFNITIPVYVDTDTMKDKLLELNKVAENVITLSELLQEINTLKSTVETLKEKFDAEGKLNKTFVPDISDTYVKISSEDQRISWDQLPKNAIKKRDDNYIIVNELDSDGKEQLISIVDLKKFESFESNMKYFNNYSTTFTFPENSIIKIGKDKTVQTQ